MTTQVNTQQTVTFDVYLESLLYLKSFKGSIANCAIIDLNTVPISIRGDYNKRNKNVAEDKALCSICDGTGNMLFFCHKPCESCEGTGVREPC